MGTAAGNLGKLGGTIGKHGCYDGLETGSRPTGVGKHLVSVPCQWDTLLSHQLLVTETQPHVYHLHVHGLV